MAQANNDGGDGRQTHVGFKFVEVDRMDRIMFSMQANGDLPRWYSRSHILRKLAREWIAEHEDVLDDDEETEVHAKV